MPKEDEGAGGDEIHPSKQEPEALLAERLKTLAYTLPLGSPELSRVQVELGQLYSRRHDETLQLADLDMSIKYYEAGVAGSNDTSTSNRQAALAASFKTRYLEFGELEDLLSSIYHLKLALGTEIPSDHLEPYSALAHFVLAGSLLQSFKILGSKDDLDTSILHHELALKLTPPTYSNIPEQQSSLASALTVRFRKFGDPEDLEDALKWASLALDNTSVNDDDYTDRQSSLAALFGDKFRQTRQTCYLDCSLEHKKAILLKTPIGHPDLPRHASSIAVTYSSRYRRLGHLRDLEAALVLIQSSISSTPSGDLDRLAARWSHLASIYTDRFQRLGESEDLDNAIKYDQLSLDATPEHNPDFKERLAALAISYTDRYQRLGSLQDMEIAITYKRRVLDGTALDDPDLAERQANLAISYTDRFRRLGHWDDLEASLSYNNLALANTPPNDPFIASRQAALAVSFTDKYNRLGALEDLEHALKYDRLALKNTPADHPDLPERYAALAVSYTDRYRRLGELNDLEAAVFHDKLAVENTPEDHPDLLERLAALAVSYTDRFKRLGWLEDLEAALTCNRSALEQTPEDRVDLVRRLAALAISYGDRYQALGELDDLEAALSYDKLALENTALDHPDLPEREIALALTYKDMYLRLGGMDCLESAMEYNRSALEHIPDDHPSIAYYHAPLALLYRYRYERLGEVGDIDKALEHHRLALENTPPGYLTLASRQESCAQSFFERYTKLGNARDLDSALEYATLALNSTPIGHPDLPGRYAFLAVAHKHRYQSLGRSDDLVECLRFAEIVIHSSTSSSSPAIVWKANVDAANLDLSDNLRLSLKAYMNAFEVLPDLMWIGGSLSTRHHSLLQYDISNASSRAAATAAALGEYNLALEFVERGLAITHQQSLELKSDDDELSKKFPKEAAKLRALSTQLLQKHDEPPGTSTSTTSHGDHPPRLNSFNTLTIERNELIGRIRSYDGFQDFLRSLPYRRLAWAAEGGPVVVLNCSAMRSDAIVVLDPLADALSVKLRDVSPERVQGWIHDLKTALGFGFGSKDDQESSASRDTNVDRFGRLSRSRPAGDYFRGLLANLWDFVVQPVFQFLHQNGYHSGRIWWCTSGLFTSLPIHAAAGIDNPYVQSYTSTLKALIQARIPKSLTKPEVFTAVGIKHTPGYPSLPLVHEEVDGILAVLDRDRNLFVKIVDAEGTRANVMKHMESSSWVHLACHGEQDPKNTLRSGLILMDGKLELGQIINANLPLAKCVFLSACETAMGDAKLGNEAMHLAAGFIVAGFQGAVGTLWSMADSDGPRVARQVYSKIIIGDKGELDVTKVAEGLHSAILTLRSSGAPFHRWIPFVHFGA